MQNSNQRMHILDMIDEGRITAEDGLTMLQILSDQVDNLEPDPGDQEIGADAAPAGYSSRSVKTEVSTPPQRSSFQAADDSVVTAPETSPTADIQKWKRWWMIPLWIGVAVTIFGGLFMFQAQQSSGIGFWLVCASIPFALGLVMIVLAWQSRNAPWLHLRVQQRPGQRPERIAFSLPLPLRQANWLIRVFGQRFAGMRSQDWEQVLQAVGKSASPETPIYIQVDEAESGEKVEIYLG